jgi:hypothetical protein
VHGGRLLAARVLAAVGAVFWGWLFFGVQDTLTVFVEGQGFAEHYLLESGWGLLFLLLVAVPLVGLAWRPRSSVLVAQVGLVGVAVLAAALIAGSPAHLVPGTALLVTAGVVALLARPPWQTGLDRWSALLAVAAAAPSLDYAWRMAGSTTDVERTVGLDHYPVQAALGLCFVALPGLVAATRGDEGTRLTATTVALAVGWMGVESTVYPHRLGSFGTVWGWLATSWAVCFLVAALRRATVSGGGWRTSRRRRGRRPRSSGPAAGRCGTCAGTAG